MRTDRAWWFTIDAQAGCAPVVVAAECMGADRFDAARDQYTHLSSAEQRRWAAMGARRADEFARGRSLLRRLAAAVLDVPADRLDIEVEPGGRPRLAQHQAGVSLSHTATYTAAALWRDGDIGIDIEEPPIRLDPSLMRRCCHGEAVALTDLPPRHRAAAFARVWSVQEACVKALGQGLSAQPWRIPVDPTADRGCWGAVRWLASTALGPVALAIAIHPTMAHAHSTELEEES